MVIFEQSLRGEKHGDAGHTDHTDAGESFRMASGKGPFVGGSPTGHPQPQGQAGGGKSLSLGSTRGWAAGPGIQRTSRSASPAFRK